MASKPDSKDKDKDQPVSSAAPGSPQALKEAQFAEQAPSNIPRAEERVAVGGGKSPDLEDYEGCYLRKSDGEKYALAIVEDDRVGRTHKATNTLHFWEGNEAQFREQFTEEDGSPIREAKESTKKDKGSSKK